MEKSREYKSVTWALVALVVVVIVVAVAGMCLLGHDDEVIQGQIEASDTMSHRNPQHSVRVCFEKIFIKTCTLRSEYQICVLAVIKMRICVWNAAFFREKPDLIA